MTIAPQFFLPKSILTPDLGQDAAWQSLCSFNHFSPNIRRAWRLTYRYNGMPMDVQVGEPVPIYYQSPGPVIAIVHNEASWCIISFTRGFYKGGPIYAPNDASPTPFAP